MSSESTAKVGKWCVHVGGLSRGTVHEYDRGIEEEDKVGYFFWNKQCKVQDVRLLIDWGSKRSRGFAFVDFEDEKSYEKALTFDGKFTREQLLSEGVELEPGRNSMMIQSATGAKSTPSSDQQKLSEMRDKTENLLQALGYRVACIQELERQAQNLRERQSRLVAGQDIGAQIKEEQKLQEEIIARDMELAAVETALLKMLPHEVERTHALEELVQGMDEGQSRVSDVGAAPTASSPDVGNTGAGYAKQSVTEDEEEPVEQIRIKNTFIEWYAPVQPTLTRLKTAPPRFTTEPESELCAPPSSPWALAREASITSRSILEEKMAEQEMTEQVEDKTDRMEESSCKEVRITGMLSGFTIDAFETEFRYELTRLWRDIRGREAPQFKVVKRSLTEVFVEFSDAEDAKWLVERRAPRSWASPENLNLRGRILMAEFASKVQQLDYRRFKTEDTDVSSQISYLTAGTMQEPRARGKGIGKSSGKGGGGYPSGTHTGPMNSPPTAIRTGNPRSVLLNGISKELPIHLVQSEVLALLRQRWGRDGHRLDPKKDLHHGQDGIVVRRGSGRDENGGSCIIKFIHYADAKWLVEQARGLSIYGHVVQAQWAKPRQMF